LYGSADTSTGANFAATICGLSIGGTWHDCARKYDEEFSKEPPENEQIGIYLRHALENLQTARCFAGFTTTFAHLSGTHRSSI
jgi:hypothetical protein